MKNQVKNQKHKQLRYLFARVSKKRGLLFVLIFSMIMLGAAIYFVSLENKRLKHNYATQDKITNYGNKFEDLYRDIRVAESSVRGYAISGDKKFIPNFTSSIDSIRANYQELKAFQNIENGPFDPKLYLELGILVQQKTELLELAKNLCETKSRSSALALIGSGEELALTDSLRKINDVSRIAIQASLKKLKAQILRIEDKNNYVFYTGIVAAMLLIVMVFYFLIQEINKAQRTSEELRIQKEYFRTTLNSLGEGLITTNKEGQIRYMNPAAEHLTGWGWKEAKYQPLQNVFSVVNEETGKPFENIVSRVLKGGEKIEFENNTILKAKDSRTFIISNNGSPLFDAKGNISGAVLVFNNISEKKKNEIELKKKNEHLQKIMDMSLDMIFTVDENGNIFSVSAASEKILGYAPEELIGRNIMDFVDKVDLEKTIQLVQEIKNGTKINNFENKYKHKNGTLVSILWSARWDENTKLRYAVARDITERKREQEAIKASEKKYRTLIEQASDAILVYSFDGTIHEFNNRAVTLSGYSSKEFAELQLSQILVGNNIIDSPKHSSLIQAGDELLLEKQFIRKDGSLRDMEVSVKMLDNKKLLAICRDITEREKTKQLLIDSENRLRTIYETEPECIKLVGRNNELLEMNPAGLAMIEADTLEMVKGHSITGILVPKYRVAFTNLTKEVFNGKSGRLDFEIIGLKGTHRWLETHAVPLKNAEGEIISLLSITRDITQKKKDEERILKEKELSDSIINSLPGVFYLLDENIQFLRWNKNFETVTGYNAAEIANMHPSDFFDTDEKDLIAEKIGDLLKNGEAHTEANIYTKAHEKIPYHLVSYKTENGGKLQLLGVGYDITDRKKAEVITQAAIAQYDILSQATSDTIWDWDMVRNKITYNKGIHKMFGYDASDVEHDIDWWYDKLHPEDFEKETESLEDVFENKQQRIQLHYRFRCSDGTYKYIFDRAFVLFDETGKPSRMIGAMQDVTYQIGEEIRMAKAIIDAQEQERNHLGAELHDNINQILAGSLLTLSMAKSEKTDTKTVTTFIETTMNYIRNAINETRKLSHHLAPVSFEEATLKDNFKSLLDNINLDNRFAIDFHFDELNEMAVPDAIQINLYRILQEQTKNILNYSEASSLEISVKITDTIAYMRIFDNGKGFNTKTAKKGIGLTNMRKRAELLSGKFILNSAACKGCEIIVEIPLVDATSLKTDRYHLKTE